MTPPYVSTTSLEKNAGIGTYLNVRSEMTPNVYTILAAREPRIGPAGRSYGSRIGLALNKCDIGYFL